MNVLEVARAWRERLQNMEDTAVREAAARYLKATQTAENRLRGILTSIETSGRQPTVTDLFTEYRLATVKQDLTNQLAAWANGEAPRLRATIDHAVSLSPAVALEMVRARATGLPPAAAASLVRHRPDETRQIIATLTRGSPLRDLLTTAAKDRAEQAIQTLVTGVALNRDPRRVAGELGKVIDGGVTRARLITRTEMLRTTREAQRQQWAAGTAVTGWVWWSTLDKTTCMVCWAMHGSRHPLDEPFGGHPACRCSMLPDVRNVPGLPPLRDVEPGDVVFARLPPADQQRILGPGRWRQYQAGDLRLGDVVKYRDDPRWGPTRTTAPLRPPDPQTPGRPAGPKPLPASVGDRLDLYPATRGTRAIVRDAVRFAVTEMDKLIAVPHGLLPRLPVVYQSREGMTAFYERDHLRRNGELVASRIGISSKAAGAPATTFTHEFGHHLDYEVLHGETMAVSLAQRAAQEQWAAGIMAGNRLPDATEPLADWYAAANIPALRSRIAAGWTPGTDLYKYFTSPVEMWARSFEQWIAVRSGNPVLLEEIDYKRTGFYDGHNPYWTDDEFGPVADAITEFFRRKGWLK